MESSTNVSKSGTAALTASTLVPLGVVVGVIVTLVSGTLYLERKFTEMERQMQTMNYNVNAQLSEIRVSMVNRWTSQDMKIWEQELKIQNPALNIPDSTRIVRSRDQYGSPAGKL